MGEKPHGTEKKQTTPRSREREPKHAEVKSRGKSSQEQHEHTSGKEAETIEERKKRFQGWEPIKRSSHASNLLTPRSWACTHRGTELPPGNVPSPRGLPGWPSTICQPPGREGSSPYRNFPTTNWPPPTASRPGTGLGTRDVHKTRHAVRPPAHEGHRLPCQKENSQQQKQRRQDMSPGGWVGTGASQYDCKPRNAVVREE